MKNRKDFYNSVNVIKKILVVLPLVLIFIFAFIFYEESRSLSDMESKKIGYIAGLAYAIYLYLVIIGWRNVFKVWRRSE